MFETITINNVDYFHMIDNEIRPAMMDYETKQLLPVAQNVIGDLETQEYPVEGYYYKTPELTEYFTIIRNIQENKKIYKEINTKTDEFQRLYDFTDRTLWGAVSSDRTKSPLPRRYDILGLTLKSFEDPIKGPFVKRPWTIDKIMDRIKDFATGTINLVELAYKIGSLECLVAGAETNILYREITHITGSSGTNPEIIWNVDPEIEEFGKKLLDEYNNLIGTNIKSPTPNTYWNFNRYPELPRVVALGYVDFTGEYYHWKLDSLRNVTDFYSGELHTTEQATL